MRDERQRYRAERRTRTQRNDSWTAEITGRHPILPPDASAARRERKKRFRRTMRRLARLLTIQGDTHG